jgi:hypothetical protein
VTGGPRLAFAFELRVQVGKPIDLGRRRVVPILGGVLEGSDMRAKILQGGADYQIIHPDGFTEAEARYVVETEQGQRIYVNNRGLRHGPPEVIARLNAGQLVDPSLIYFRTVPTFETSVPELQWLTRTLFVGIGERYPEEVVVRFYQVL